MKSRIILFVFGFFIWCLLCWVPDWQHLLVGCFAAGFTAWTMGDLFITKPQIFKHPHRYWYFVVYYIPFFLWECIKANIDVAYRVLHPGLPINPGIVKVKTSLRSDTGLTFLANSITLTPGTMSVDIDSEKGILYIHCINVTNMGIEGATKEIVDKFEKILVKIFE